MRKKLIVPYEAEIEFMGDEPMRDVMLAGGKGMKTPKKAKQQLLHLLKVNEKWHEDKASYYRKKMLELKRLM
jgi:hypothetical protein